MIVVKNQSSNSNHDKHIIRDIAQISYTDVYQLCGFLISLSLNF